MGKLQLYPFPNQKWTQSPDPNHPLWWCRGNAISKLLSRTTRYYENHWEGRYIPFSDISSWLVMSHHIPLQPYVLISHYFILFPHHFSRFSTVFNPKLQSLRPLRLRPRAATPSAPPAAACPRPPAVAPPQAAAPSAGRGGPATRPGGRRAISPRHRGSWWCHPG